MEGMSATWLDSMLVGHWLPAVPGMVPRLAEGARVADVGCGGGHALVLLATAFPNSRFVGYDAFGENVARARASAAAAGVSDRVAFVEAEATGSLDGPFDLVTAFDVLHDAPNLDGLLRSIRTSLCPDGVLLVLESQGTDDPVDNRGPAATVLYATSVLYCVPTSLAEGGEGLGTLGLPAGQIRDHCGRAGFRSVRPVPGMGPFNALYEVRP
jgi:2-polyprenyl-3-methyl-5-hydroxy-6-metoxy-1,4-benzoquinol methylase